MTAAPLNCEVLAMGARWRPPLGVGVPVVGTVKEKHRHQLLAASLAKRAPGYTSLGYPDPRHIPHTPGSRTPGKITDPPA